MNLSDEKMLALHSSFPVAISEHLLYPGEEGGLNISTSYEDVIRTSNILLIGLVSEEKQALIKLPIIYRGILSFLMTISL